MGLLIVQKGRPRITPCFFVLIVIVIVRTFGEHEQIFVAVPRAVAYPGCRFSKMGLSFEPPRKPGLFVATHAIVAPDTRPKLFQRR